MVIIGSLFKCYIVIIGLLSYMVSIRSLFYCSIVVIGLFNYYMGIIGSLFNWYIVKIIQLLYGYYRIVV